MLTDGDRRYMRLGRASSGNFFYNECMEYVPEYTEKWLTSIEGTRRTEYGD